MALFRKKLNQEQCTGLLINLFCSRFEVEFVKVHKEILKLSGGDASYIFDDQRKERAQDLWIVCAALLSQMRQSGEAAAMTRYLLKTYSDSDSEYDQMTLVMSNAIVSSHKNDQNLFHNVTHEIFTKIYAGAEKYISCYPNQITKTYNISGIELASCLRGVDFLLKDFKVAS